MTRITTYIANAFDKVVNDFPTAAQADMQLLAQASFELALQYAFQALFAAL